MREFVYLSDNKLRQFLDQGSRRRWWPASGKVNLTLPVGSLEMQQQSIERGSEPLETRLGAVTEHVDLSARWYDDADVMTGEWIAFELPLLYALDDRLVLFVDPLNPRDVQQTRLLLHGSTDSMNLDLRSDAQRAGTSVPHSPSQPSFVYDLEKTFLSLKFIHDPLNYEAEARGDPGDRLRRSVSRVIAALDGNFSPVTAAWMRGLARVSAAFESLATPSDASDLRDESPSVPGRIVVASPLYVERAPIPKGIDLQS